MKYPALTTARMNSGIAICGQANEAPELHAQKRLQWEGAVKVHPERMDSRESALV
ncbi:hypothetical protein [Peribacillus muralis]|uniref:hypothetical protein n=1 Tax=Peribacillus muralis TaxID=264697 RepID=UPI003CFDDD70